MDGSDPTNSSTKYTGAFSVSTNTTVKAIAIDNLGLSSGVLERDYEFKTPKDVVVRFKPPTTTPNWHVAKNSLLGLCAYNCSSCCKLGYSN